MQIKPSVMWHTQHPITSTNVITSFSNKNYHRVCYSMHSSYSEIRYFVGYIRPQTVYPNVAPNNSTLEEVGVSNRKHIKNYQWGGYYIVARAI